MLTKNKLIVKKVNIFIILYFLSYIIHYYTDIDFTLSYIVWILLGILGYILLYKEVKKNISVIGPLLIIDAIALFNLFITQNHSPFNAFMLLVSQMFGLYLYEFRRDLKALLSIIYMICLYMLIYIIIMPKTIVNISLGDYYTYFSSLMGGNTISIFLLLFISIDIIYRRNVCKPINYILVLSSLFMAYKGGGTGGVLSIAVLLFMLLSLKWYQDKISRKRMSVFLIICLIVVFLFGYWDNLFEVLSDSNSRFWIWSNYWECATKTIDTVIFGGSVKDIPFLNIQKNMHNTFINWHYYYGLIPQLYFIYIVLKSVYESIKYKRHILFIILCVLLLRGMTDETTFCFMPIWTFAILECTNYKRMNYANND